MAALGRHRSDGAARPAVAAATALLPAPADEEPVAAVVPPERPTAVPPVRDVPLGPATAAVPVLITAPTPVFDPLALCGTELVVPTPVVSAPGPVTVPAVAAPPTVALALAAVGDGGFGLVLVSVPSGVVAAPGFGAAIGAAGARLGNVTAPLPVCPPPVDPGVGPPAASSVVDCCAAAGMAAASIHSITKRIDARMPR